MLDIVLSILSCFLLIIGIIGAVIPIIPGPAITWLGILIFYFTDYSNISGNELGFITLMILTVMALDYILPGFITKKLGGSKQGINGATIGMIAGSLTGIIPLAIFGSIIGVFIGELIHDNNDFSKAFKSSIGAFLAFLVTTGGKLFLSIWYFIDIITHIYFHIKDNNIT